MTDTTSGTVRLRATLESVPRYVAGKPATEQPGRTTYKISSNENPYPPLPSVLDVVRDAMQTMNRYPDMGTVELRDAIAERFGVHPDEIATGTGSVGLLGTLLQITCEPGDEVVYAWRSFEAYPIVVGLSGATGVQVPLDGEARHDLSAMADAITERTRLIVVCTPNNPTGPAVHAAELDEFLAHVPRDVLVLLDEAYLEFNRDADAADALAVWRKHPNVAVLRTFSKAYGLAGLRVGYCIAHEQVASALRTAAVPFGVSHIAQRAAIASLAAYDELEERVVALVAERDRLLIGLRDLGYAVPDTQANFVWLPLGDRTLDFAAAAEEAGVVVRPFAGDGVRCSVGEVEATDRLLEVAAAFTATGR
ncbi:histidinol-phosphate transaminase [Flexivirga caeni]|uniref:Aromatic amino acid aminotransferase n=1 Tax=Flexivirga caeni TaxID=2294115 RepID=A0A3M9MIM7_9MICO|nr:histidinol-phosphate transaminase [Flexivirga caeni]RNI25412.1 histidinol-phosphate transaminase [Flexivirga caeni]